MCFTLNCDDPPTVGCEALADWTGCGWALCERCHDKFHDGRMGFLVRFEFGPWPIAFQMWLLGGQGILLDIGIVDMTERIDEDLRRRVTGIEEWLREQEGGEK